MNYRDEFDGPDGDHNISQRLDQVRRQVMIRTRGPAVAVGVLVVMALVLAAVVFFTYPGSDDPDVVPIIQADARPFKVTPDDPGGMAIPHRDSTVFSTMRTSRLPQDAQVENLLADNDSEDPIRPSQLFAGLNTEEADPDNLNEVDPSAGTEDLLEEGLSQKADGGNAEFAAMKEESFAAPTMGTAIEQQQDEEQAAPVAVKPAAKPAAPASKPSPSIEVARYDDTPSYMKQDAPSEAATSEPAPAPTPVSIGPATHYVQIGAVTSEDKAEKGWASYQKEYGSILAGLSHRVERADLGEKGIYYRIQAGPVSKERAADVCSAIKAQKPGGCLVVGQ